VVHRIGFAISDLQLDRTPAALMLYDARGTVIDANAAACHILGKSQEQLIGTTMSDPEWQAIESPAGPTSEHPVAVVLKTRAEQRGHLVHVRDRWLLCDAVPLGDNVALTLMDVTHVLARGGVGARAAGDQLIAEIEDELSAARFDGKAILRIVVDKLSAVRAGMWIAVVLGKDPGTSTVVLRDADTALTRYLETYFDSISGSTTGPKSAVSQRVIDEGTPLLLNNASLSELMSISSDPAREYMSAHRIPIEIGATDVMVVPMRARGAIIGTLGLFERRTSSPLTQKDVAWLQSIADRVGLAVENAQLYEDALKRLDRLSSLASVGLALRTSSDLKLTLKLILDQALSRLKVDAADVLAVDESGTSLGVVESSGFRSSVADYRVPVSEAMPAPEGGRRVETVTVLGAFSQSRRRSLFAREGFRSYGAVPLIARDKLLGVLEIFHRAPLEPDQEWLSFLDALGGEAALAIDSAASRQRPRTASRRRSPELSALDTQILRLLVEGKTNSEIAAAVHLSQSGVKSHVRNLLDKTGAANRVDLTHMATSEGWV
jgi:GAF domain-containing protein